MIIEPPGEPTARNGLPCLVMIVGAIELRGRLPPSDAVGRGLRRVVEVRQLVVEQHAGAGHDDAVAARGLDGERVGHDHAVVVGDRQVRRRRAIAQRRRDAGRAAVAARYRRVDGAVGDRARGARRRTAARAGSASGTLTNAGSPEVLAAVGERVARRLEEAVQRLRAVGAERLVALEDVQRLTDGRAAAGRRAHAPHLEALVVDLGRLALDRAVLGEVLLGDQALAPHVVGVAAIGGCLRRVGDRLGQRAAVERVGAVAPDVLVGLGQIRVAAASCRRRAACRPGRGRSPRSTGRR